MDQVAPDVHLSQYLLFQVVSSQFPGRDMRLLSYTIGLFSVETRLVF